MHISKAIETLQALNQTLTQDLRQHKYLCHYRFQEKLKDCIKVVEFPAGDSEDNKKLISELKVLQTRIQHDLNELKAGNEKKIKSLDFEKTCMSLIKANDVTNFSELVNIGHYFGIGRMGTDVLTPLFNLYDFFKKNASMRTVANKPCVDKLCEILRYPLLPVPQSYPQPFSKPRETLTKILKTDGSTDLMMWLLHATQEDRDFALRCAAATDTSKNCLGFLLCQTAPGKQKPINLLAAGLPSKQIALHRAVLSGKTLIVAMLLDTEINPSLDLLRQLLVCDKDGLTPVELIRKIKKNGDAESVVSCSLMLTRIREALVKNQTNPQLQLSLQELHVVNTTIDKIQAEVELDEKMLSESRQSFTC